MLTLQGHLSATDLQIVREKTKLMFKDISAFKTPEALIIHEQQLLSEKELLHVCCEEYGDVLFTPKREYIPQAMLDMFKGTNCVPVKYVASTNTMYVGVLPELPDVNNFIGNMEVKPIKVPIYYYVDNHMDYYGQPDFLYNLAEKDYLDFIYSEALKLRASDVTIFNTSKTTADVIYNVRKRLVKSSRRISGDVVLPLAHLLATSGSATFDASEENPRFFSVRVDLHNRGRVVVNKTYHGWCITIRVLPDDYLDTSLEDLNIKDNAVKFIRECVLSEEKGLRLLIGETMSGKNTTILSALLEKVKEDKYKIVSLESPVETLVKGIIQIDADTEDLFVANADSLLRQNPDIEYFTEITERTAASILKHANTSKAVFSSVHANSVADVISRLMDITSLDSDRVVQALQSCVYQVLVRDEEKDEVRPVNRCVHFDYALKSKLYGKPLFEKYAIIKEVEDAWEA